MARCGGYGGGGKTSPIIMPYVVFFSFDTLNNANVVKRDFSRVPIYEINFELVISSNTPLPNQGRRWRGWDGGGGGGGGGGMWPWPFVLCFRMC